MVKIQIIYLKKEKMFKLQTYPQDRGDNEERENRAGGFQTNKDW